MWTEVRNNNNTHEEPQDHSLKQIVSQVSSWLPFNSDRNGSVTASPPPLAETPVNRPSGIIPGAIAAAVFIGLLLALYAVLWKCMVTRPKSVSVRRKKRTSLKAREQRSLMC
ncbi:uncharacterized protein sb:cb288 [Rhinichthys klamathensis goyatoka]|uniref:uncharacterized protein sb:cb288 n=1 Tax=Rhinichthys klamathensis goyatoka TaxID=3034132 RepID=UPI0024B5DD4D|nr:uncharacterized protein sb:cb288 [Rhinichthys klamathensis goyatoka]